MSEELVTENYHGCERVKKRESEVMQRWRELLQLLDKHRINLTTLCTLMSMLREIDTIMATIKDLEVIYLFKIHFISISYISCKIEKYKSFIIIAYHI